MALLDIWQLNMINCCGFELGFALVPNTDAVLIHLPDGRFLEDFGNMLRVENNCLMFIVDKYHFLCPGHAEWSQNSNRMIHEHQMRHKRKC